MRRAVPAGFLLLEGIASAVWVAGLVQALPGYSAVVIGLVILRGLIGALQAASGWMLLTERPPGEAFAPAAFIASAFLTTFETGLRLAPSNADPTYRWVFVAVYWVYAVGMSWLLRQGVRAD